MTMPTPLNARRLVIDDVYFERWFLLYKLHCVAVVAGEEYFSRDRRLL